MDSRRTKGRTPFVAGVVLLLLLLFSSCTHTQQEPDAALRYSPTLQELEESSLSVPEEAKGFGRIYELVGMETFSNLQRGPAPGFRLEEGGTFPVADDDHWIVGYSSGASDYLQYYRTDSSQLPLKPGHRYELRFTYRVLETPDKGFEAIFFSGDGASRNDWVEQSVFFNEPEGSSGEQVQQFQLKDYDDYTLVMNVVHKGKIAVTDITIIDLETNTIVAMEDTMGSWPTHSPYVLTEGNIQVGASSIEGSDFSLTNDGFVRIMSDPASVSLPPDTIFIVEFDWKVLRRVPATDQTSVGFIRVTTPGVGNVERTGISIPSYQRDAGHFVGGIKTGEEAIPYMLELLLFDNAVVELTNLKLSQQRSVKQEPAEHPAQGLASVPFPRLGNIHTHLGEWVANDGGGSATGDRPWMNAMELERKIAYSDIVVAMHQMHGTHDPAASIRLRKLNPGIVLLPLVPTQHFGIDDQMLEQFGKPLISSEIQLIEGIKEDWYLRDPKGNILNDSGAYRNILCNISPFCSRDELGETYLDYWPKKVLDLHVRDGSWDGLYLDQLYARTNPLIKGAYAGTKINADYNLNQKKDETLVWTHEMTAASSLRMLRSLRDQFGSGELILTSPSFDYRLAPLSNGVAVMFFNAPWYYLDEGERFNEMQWAWTVDNCNRIMGLYQEPVAVVLEARPLFSDGTVPESKRNADETDLEYQRLAIGTALLTDAFYEYDIVDTRSAPIFFDEMLVDASGRSTQDISGKGWLGGALGPAVELVSNREVISTKPEPFLLGNKGTKSKTLYRGRNSGTETTQYSMEFDWKLLENTSTVPVVNVSVNDTWVGYYDIPDLFAGSSGHARFHVTVEPKQEVLFKLTIGKQGVVEIGNMTVTKADAGVYRRDFAHGLVLVNATREEKIVSLAQISGDLGRTGIKRILGTLDPTVNTGEPVGEPLVLKPHDAIILLAD